MPPIKAGGALAIRPKSFEQGCYEIEMAPEAMKVQAPRYGEIALPVSILPGALSARLKEELTQWKRIASERKIVTE